jgi:hypothetical protein
MGDTNHYFDIDYEVIPNPKRKNSTPVENNERAIINAYKIWLLSGKNDYIRNPGFAGFFDSQLNDKFKFLPENEPQVEAAIRTETTDKWPDIEIMTLTVKCDMPTRAWIVSITVMDRNTRAAATDLVSVDAAGYE